MADTMTTKKEKEQPLPQFVLPLTTTLRCSQVRCGIMSHLWIPVVKQSTQYKIMIRKNSLFCKLFRINISSVALFKTFMSRFRPELETCPICGAKGHCHIHAYYDRYILDAQGNSITCDQLHILRVCCDSCSHTHAILPDFIIPYSGYGLLFILQVLAEYFSHCKTIDKLCEKFSISAAQLYKWLELWHNHKHLWLGVLDDAALTDDAFFAQLYSGSDFSGFSRSFIRSFAFSFLQSHRNPSIGLKNARYCQNVFEPDYRIT